MKNYFDFRLKGRQFFPLWMVYYLLIVIPHTLMFLKHHLFDHAEVHQKLTYGHLLLFVLDIMVVLVWNFYFTKIVLQNLILKEPSIKCDYSLGKYLGVIFQGLILSILTIGIYIPWFTRNIQLFFVDNSSYKDKNFSFQGQGGKLFLIMTLALVVPIILIVVILKSVAKRYGIDGIDLKNYLNSYVAHQILKYIILVPCYYLVLKWHVDIKYSDYHIKWDTKFLPTIGKIFWEVGLSIITVGIYLPLAFLRLYKYFTEKTKSNQIDNQSIQFGYDIDQLNDFKMIWGQLLLTAVTLGVYYPWAFCKIGQRVLGKTYMEKINS